MSKKFLYYLERAAAIFAAVIFLQTLYYKFTAHPDSVHIFTLMGGEPYTRIGSGILELIIGVLLIFPKTSLYEAISGLLVTIGAIGSRIFVLGISVNNDRGTLFALAITAFLCCATVVILKRASLRRITNK
jgi:hypothetical protein